MKVGCEIGDKRFYSPSASRSRGFTSFIKSALISPSARSTSDLLSKANLCALRIERYLRPVFAKDGCFSSRTKSVGSGSPGMEDEMKRQRTSSILGKRLSGVKITAGRTFAPDRSVNGYLTRITLPRLTMG